MQFPAFIWRNLLRRPVRSGLTIVGLSVAVAAGVALVGISDGFFRQDQELYDHRGVDLVVQKVGRSAELNNSLPEDLAENIRKIPHLKECNGGRWEPGSLPDRALAG